MYVSAGTSVSNVGAGAGRAAAFGGGFGVVCRFCCAVAVRVIRSSKITTTGWLIAFMGVKPLVFFLSDVNTIAAIRHSFANFLPQELRRGEDEEGWFQS